MSEPSPKNAKALIRAEELKHSFEEGDSVVQALRGVSFEARTSEMTAVIGQSGCGKSTLLLLGLLDRPQSGEIYLKGRPMAKASNEERTAHNETIGFVFQFHFLIKELTARERALPLRKSGVGSASPRPAAGLLDRRRETRQAGSQTSYRVVNSNGSPLPEPSQTRPLSSLPTNPREIWTARTRKTYSNSSCNLPESRKLRSCLSRTTPN